MRHLMGRIAMVIAVVNQKGGVGKTTLSVNIAGALSDRLGSVLLIDADPQGSVLQWNAISQSPRFAVKHHPGTFSKRERAAFSRDYRCVVIDTPPSLSKITQAALKIADLAIVPVAPSPLDIWSTKETVTLINKIRNLGVRLLVYRKIPGTRIGKEAHEVLKSYKLKVFATEISQRIAFVDAMNSGDAVIHYAPSSKAASEVGKLADELITLQGKN
jgi:chromosome partitioning protein